ncbi:MAG: elongation factor P hydroxylase [Desulforhopalus sp.]|jgi:elongation factor P hydroxylase
MQGAAYIKICSITYKGATMFKRTNHVVALFSLSIVMTFTTPILTMGDELGEDWYCKDHEVHAQYQKHLKHHLNRAAETITESLEKIYSDPELTKAEKQEKTLEVIDKHLSKMKNGIGD